MEMSDQVIELGGKHTEVQETKRIKTDLGTEQTLTEWSGGKRFRVRICG